MDLLLDVERVLLGMVAGAVVLFVAAVRPHLPEDDRDRIAGSVWPLFNRGAFAASAAVVVLAAVRLADGSDRALVHVIGGVALLTLLLVKSRLDARIARQVAAATGGEAGGGAVQRDIRRVIPMVVATLVLSLGLALAPA